MAVDDKYLFRKIKEGDKTAFKILYKKYYAGLFVYAMKITSEEKVTEELVDDLFIHIWANRERLHIKSSFRSYLYRAMRNNCLTHLRQNNLKNLLTDEFQDRTDAALDYLSISQENGLSIILSKEASEDIENAINKLPDQCRNIFQMSRYEELKNKEIAEKLGVSVNTVETQISRALNKLRTSLKKYLPFLMMSFFKLIH